MIVGLLTHARERQRHQVSDYAQALTFAAEKSVKCTGMCTLCNCFIDYVDYVDYIDYVDYVD